MDFGQGRFSGALCFGDVTQDYQEKDQTREAAAVLQDIATLLGRNGGLRLPPSTFFQHKAEVTHRLGPWKTADAVDGRP